MFAKPLMKTSLRTLKVRDLMDLPLDYITKFNGQSFKIRLLYKGIKPSKNKLFGIDDSMKFT